MGLFIAAIVYLLLFVFVLAVMYLKIKQKEKIRPVWIRMLCFLVLLLILYIAIIDYIPPPVIEVTTKRDTSNYSEHVEKLQE